ncbi:carboxymuconolactone decarboxylase family protein [Pedobacter sp. HMF7647]|uniref:Carboxymuconolactone decarboxylase family protein n=1 Tax=Hufsiella arboris TaxID=2695275 RepID=A0A7K1YF83_9SPHI|nr:carboxymuconolactone decarboxylase family protein [Hufsiella arboris]MXV53264.1 carboxymuconolactone decarboxylase family protein [Hufsiella arboris]
MPHINLDKDLPGMRSLLAFCPEIGEPLGQIANILLRSNDSLSMADRELIGAYVSYLNDCFYCQHSHAAIAVCYLNGDTELVEQVVKDFSNAPISNKLKALLTIAGSVQKGGKFVTTEQVEAAKAEGATDRDIHDTVLIAAAFCLFNRYVDGLATTTPTDMSSYPLRAKQVAETGYGNHIATNPQPAAHHKEH